LMAKTLMMLDDGSSQHRYSVVESASAKVPKCQAHFRCGFCNRATYWISPSRFSLFYGSREISVRVVYDPFLPWRPASGPPPFVKELFWRRLGASHGSNFHWRLAVSKRCNEGKGVG
jgi:hypothetical protein